MRLARASARSFADHRTHPTLADFVQTLIATISVGSLYALLALGYTMVYGVLKFINFAHSDIFVLGAWTSFTVATVVLTALGVSAEQAPLWVGPVTLLSAILVCGGVGFCIERFAYRPLRRAPRLNVLITAIGVSLLLQNAGQIPGAVLARDPQGTPVATLPFGASPRSMPLLLPDGVLNESLVAQGTAQGGSRRGTIVLDQAIEVDRDVPYRVAVVREVDGKAKRESLNLIADEGRHEAGTEFGTQPRRSPDELHGVRYKLWRAPTVPIRLVDVLVTCSALILMVGLHLLVFHTKTGTAMRAISHSIDTAALMGININRVISLTFLLGTTLAACAAFLYPMKYPGLNQTAHGIWVLLGLKAFAAAVVGGIGNIRGAVLGGFLIAAIEFFGAKYIEPALQDIYVFGVLILVLLVRPSGLLGKPTREKV